MGALKFDENYNVEDFTFIVSTRSYVHQGALSNVTDVVYRKNMNSAQELSFNVYKVLDGYVERNWDKLDDLKLIWVKDLDTYYTIEISLKDGVNPCKSVTATSLCESELSQVNLYGIEINTENDIARDDYVITKFYNSENTEGSLLHRVLSKVPHYSIKHVDASLKDLQRTFTIDGVSIYDFLIGECAEQFNCIFQFDTTDRSISVYDLYTVCKSCGYRGEFNDECPECLSSDLKYYGEDTTIYIDKDNLAEEISLTTDVGSIKNCFKLVAGDDDMTAAVRNINPNGTDYIYHITDEQKADMSQELVDRIAEYDVLYESKVGDYTAVVENIYECIDQILYYEHEMMPDVDLDHDDNPKAQDEANKLTYENLNPTAISVLSAYTSPETVNSAVKNYAKVYIKTGYFKLDVNESTFKYIEDGNYGTWTGNFKVESYSDEEDIAYSPTITIKIVSGEDEYETFIRQKIDKLIASDSEDEESIYDVLGIEDLEKFEEALTYYCLNRLLSFKDSIQGVLDIMIESDQASEEADLYDTLYDPYYKKMQAVEKAIDARQTTIDLWKAHYDGYNDMKNTIQEELNFENFLGQELYKEFCTYRREDTYDNSNYISDGLNNDELFKNAQDFLETAKKELYKASNRQHSISSTLANLLVMKEFKKIADKFDVGNWIRIGIDGKIYRLRLLSYEISFSDLQNIDVEFSDVTKIKDAVSDVKSVLDSAQSMATNFSYVSKQAEKGEVASKDINEWVKDGLDSSMVQIKNNTNEEITYGKHGLLARSWDDVTESYSDEQLKITHNVLVFTSDNWKTAEVALGKHNYKYYDEENGKFDTDTGYGLTAKFLNAGYVHGSQMVGGDIYSENYSSTAGSHLNLNDGTFSLGGGKLTYDGSKLSVDGSINSKDGTIGNWSINDTSIYKGSETFGNASGMYFGDSGLSLGNKFKVTSSGTVTATDIYVTGGEIGGAKISDSSISTTNWSINKDGTATFKNLTLQGVSSGSNFGGITYDGSNTTGNFNGGIAADKSFGVTNGALTDFNDLVVKNITAENIKATNVMADYATINQLNAINIDASQITSGTITTDRLDVDGIFEATDTRSLSATFYGLKVGAMMFEGHNVVIQKVNGVPCLTVPTWSEPLA